MPHKTPSIHRFFFYAKFESKCHKCRMTVAIGEKAMLRPAQGVLPKLFLCLKCANAWLPEELRQTTP